jgi:hypothetical protein
VLTLLFLQIQLEQNVPVVILQHSVILEADRRNLVAVLSETVILLVVTFVLRKINTPIQSKKQ